jgi:hypothetical protein
LGKHEENDGAENAKVPSEQLKPFKGDRVIWKEETWIASVNFSSRIQGNKSKKETRVGNIIPSWDIGGFSHNATFRRPLSSVTFCKMEVKLRNQVHSRVHGGSFSYIRVLSSAMWFSVVWPNFCDVSVEITASIFRFEE